MASPLTLAGLVDHLRAEGSPVTLRINRRQNRDTVVADEKPAPIPPARHSLQFRPEARYLPAHHRRGGEFLADLEWKQENRGGMQRSATPPARVHEPRADDARILVEKDVKRYAHVLLHLDLD